MAAAAVSVTGRREVVQSNRRGQFVLSALPVGEYEISIRHIGYAPLTHTVTVTRGHTTEVDVRLSPDPVELEPLVATVARIRRLETQGFYERKYWGELIGGGTFFTVQDIERRNPFLITDLIADAPGVRVRCGGRARSCKVYSRRISTGFGGRGCEMTVYVDGTPVIQPGRSKRHDHRRIRPPHRGRRRRGLPGRGVAPRGVLRLRQPLRRHRDLDEIAPTQAPGPSAAPAIACGIDFPRHVRIVMVSPPA